MFFKFLILNRAVARLCLKPLLLLHSVCYRWISRFAIILNNGIHPKHSIINYEQWFYDNIQQGWCVLDIGCNTGLLAKRLASKASFIYGVDIDRTLIREAEAQNAFDNAEYICADACDFDYKTDRKIDCVILSNLLEHIEDRVGFLKRLVALVNWDKGKIFLIRVPTIERDWLTVYKKNLAMPYMLDKTHYIEYTSEEFVDELEQAGIKVVKMENRFGEIYAVCFAL
jgi:2-polyprenyl-3-methyl-5-hydroxy-6-metoxy-1,4-benzoquinol methylase